MRFPGTAVALVLLSLAVPRGAQAAEVGFQASTLGAGIYSAWAFDKVVAIRVFANGINLGQTVKESGLRYDADFRLRSVGAVAELRPNRGSFFFSAGAFQQNSEADLNFSTTGSAQIGNSEYLGTVELDGTARIRGITPFLGFGWSGVAYKPGWNARLELGAALLQGRRADLSGSGHGCRLEGSGECTNPSSDLGSDPDFQSDVALERAALNAKLKGYRVYPVVSLAIGKRFR